MSSCLDSSWIVNVPEPFRSKYFNGTLEDAIASLKADGYDVEEDYQQFDEQGCYYGATDYYVYDGNKRLFVF